MKRAYPLLIYNLLGLLAIQTYQCSHQISPWPWDQRRGGPYCRQWATPRPIGGIAVSQTLWDVKSPEETDAILWSLDNSAELLCEQ